MISTFGVSVSSVGDQIVVRTRITHLIPPVQTPSKITALHLSLASLDSVDFTVPLIIPVYIVLGTPQFQTGTPQQFFPASDIYNFPGVQKVLFVADVVTPITQTFRFGHEPDGAMLVPPGNVIAVILGDATGNAGATSRLYWSSVLLDGYQVAATPDQNYGRDPVTRIGR
jgi:hypothetical protein